MPPSTPCAKPQLDQHNSALRNTSWTRRIPSTDQKVECSSHSERASQMARIGRSVRARSSRGCALSALTVCSESTHFHWQPHRSYVWVSDSAIGRGIAYPDLPQAVEALRMRRSGASTQARCPTQNDGCSSADHGEVDSVAGWAEPNSQSLRLLDRCVSDLHSPSTWIDSEHVLSIGVTNRERSG